MEEALPSRFQPTPLSVSQLELLDTAFDPALIATPERRLPTVVPLQNRSSVSPITEEHSSGGRVVRVHFDKNVAVHHISPECIDSFESQDELLPVVAGCRTEGMVCPELNLSNLSDNEPISIVVSDSKKSSLSSTNSTKALTSSAKRLTHVTNNGNDSLKSSVVKRLNLERELVTSSSAGDAAEHKSQARKKVPSESSSRKSAFTPLVVSATRSTVGLHPNEDASRLNASSQGTELQCVLAKPELNSTLRLGREIEQAKEQEFNLSNVMKEKINPKMKNKLAEKAYSKLNAESDMFPCLIGIDVSETDLVTQLAREQSNRLFTSETLPKEKAESKISRIPDVLDFFTCDLHKETPSISIVASSTLRLEPRAARLGHAFDLYRHIRSWNKL